MKGINKLISEGSSVTHCKNVLERKSMFTHKVSGLVSVLTRKTSKVAWAKSPLPGLAKFVLMVCDVLLSSGSSFLSKPVSHDSLNFAMSVASTPRMASRASVSGR